MTPEQKAVVLDYVTEWQTNEQPWREFEWLQNSLKWVPCTAGFNPLYAYAPHYVYRRKPKTITVTIPAPSKAEAYVHSATGLLLWFDNHVTRDQALAAIREAIKDE